MKSSKISLALLHVLIKVSANCSRNVSKDCFLELRPALLASVFINGLCVEEVWQSTTIAVS